MSMIHITIADISSHNEKVIELRETDSVADLDTLLSIDHSHKWIFNGQILSQAFSLQFYGIKNGDRIYLYNSNFKNIQNKEATYFQKFRKNKPIDEILKIKDILYQRIEGNYHSNRKLIKAYNNFEEPEEENSQTTKITEITATGPSTENLPLLWQCQPAKN